MAKYYISYHKNGELKPSIDRIVEKENYQTEKFMIIAHR